MIGNDIVDLEAAQQHSRWQEQRFLDKLFSDIEQAFILSHNNRLQNIWRLWSMKESAYKLIARVERKSRFNPKDFQCIITDSTVGSVGFKASLIKTETITRPKYLQSIAFLTPNWNWSVIKLSFSDPQFQRTETYTRIIEKYSVIIGSP